MLRPSQVTPTPYPRHFSPVLTPTFTLPALTTFLSLPLHSAPSQVSRTQPVSIRASNPDFDLGPLAPFFFFFPPQSAQSSQTGIWDSELINEQIRVQGLLPKQAGSLRTRAESLAHFSHPL